MPNPFNTADGNWVGDGADKTITLGYQPSKVVITGETDNIVFITNSGFTSPTTVIELATTPAIVVGSAGKAVITSTGFVLPAALNTNLSTFSYVAIRRES